MISKINFNILLLTFFWVCALIGCKKEFDYRKTINAVKTSGFSEILQTTTKVSGTIVTDNGASLSARGICYGITENPAITGSKKTDPSTTLGNFTCLLNNLSPGSTYYARAYATNRYGTAYGNAISFTTQAATIPILSSTTAANLITPTSTKSGGTITNTGASSVTSRGVCYSNTVTIPTIADSKTNDGTGIGTFISSLNGLSFNTKYYIRAYATNAIGTAYGDVKTFSTTPATIPSSITTSPLTTITQTTAMGAGNIAGDGGAAIVSRGVCWSTSTTTPTIINAKTIDGTGAGSFTSSLTGLAPGSTYYVRAYATNSVGTAYGNLVFFNTLAATLPTGITTTSVSLITATSASSGGSITSDGGTPIMSRGVCWSSTTSSPTIANSITNNGTGIGSFTSSLTGLTANTTYYVKAYATNSVGTAYGNFISFTTQPPPLAEGQNYQGGIIAYIFQPGDLGYIAGQTHGLISSTSNQSTGVVWGCSGTSIPTSTSIGTGQNNTTAIVNNCITTNIAARICDNLNLGGYSDWFLPSSEELLKLYLNRTVIGGFISTQYWTSSQYTSTNTLSVNFSTGNLFSTAKTSVLYIRAVRNF